MAPVPAVIEQLASTVGRFLSRASYLPSYVFLRRRRKTLRWSREIIVFRVIGDLHVNQGFISDESLAFALFQAKINLKFHVTLRSLIGLFNCFIKKAKTIRNVAGGNFTRGFAAREIPSGLMAAPSPLTHSRIPPATQAIG